MSSLSQSCPTRSSAPTSRSWGVLAAVTICYLFFYTGRINFAWAVPAMSTELGLSYTQIAYIQSGLLLSYGLGQILNGWWGDRASPHLLIAGGALASVFLNWLMSWSSSFGVLLTLWFLNGYAQACGFGPGSRILADSWPKSHQGLAFGGYVSSVGLSTTVTYAACALVNRELPWRWLFRLPVLLLLVSTLAAVRVLKAPNHADSRPREAGWSTMILLLRQRRFLLLAAAMGATNIARQTLLAWAPLHVLGPAWRKPDGAAWILLWLPVGMAAGTVAMGFLFDRLPTRQTLLACSALASAAVILTVLWWIPHLPAALTMVALFLTGFLLFGPQSIFWAWCADIAGARHVSSAVGLMNAISYGLASAAASGVGVWLDRVHDTHVVFAASALMTMVAAAILFTHPILFLNDHSLPLRRRWGAVQRQ